MDKLLPHAPQEDLLLRIATNRHCQSDLIESMVGQFGGTEQMQNLMREEIELSQELKQIDTVNEPVVTAENS